MTVEGTMTVPQAIAKIQSTEKALIDLYREIRTMNPSEREEIRRNTRTATSNINHFAKVIDGFLDGS